MKKVYESPEIAVEYFELTQAIAACAVEINANDSACVLADDDATGEMKSLAYYGYFRSGACNVSSTDEIQGVSPEGMGSDDGVCYHTNANMAWRS